MTQSYAFTLPTKMRFGVGLFDQIGAELAPIGQNAFVMMDPFLKGSSLEQRLDEQLSAAGIGATKWFDIVPNPRASTCDKAAALAKREICDMVLAIGGGSTIDAAKAVALVAVHGGQAWDYTIRAGQDHIVPATAGLPLVAVPTSAGTGAEVTPFAVLSNQEEKLKATIKHDACFPSVAIVDPSLHVSKPKALTASTGVDTFLHAFEGYLTTQSNSWTETLALQAMQKFAKHIRVACNDGTNLVARTGMAEACYLAGLSLAAIGVGVPHSLGQALGALKDTPHGISCAACLIPTVEWSLSDSRGRMDQVARLLDPELVRLPFGKAGDELVGCLRSLFEDIELTDNFSSLGLRRSEVEPLLDIAFANYDRGISRWMKLGGRQEMKEIVLASL